MFEEENYAALVVAAKKLEDGRNRLLADVFIQAAKNWAIRADGPPPVAPRKQSITADRTTMDLIVTTLAEPVSSLDPQSLVATPGTDAGAVGGRVGGPIPDLSGRFYLVSHARAMHGDTEQVGARTFKFVTPMFGLGGYWVEQ